MALSQWRTGGSPERSFETSELHSVESRRLRKRVSTMKTNMNELNLNEMEMVNGGYGIKDFAFDALGIVLGGPIGEALVAIKYIDEAIN